LYEKVSADSNSKATQNSEAKLKLKDLREKIKERCEDNMELSNKCYFMLESTILKNNEFIDLLNKDIQQTSNNYKSYSYGRSMIESKDKQKEIEIRLSDKKKIKKISKNSFIDN